MDEQRLKKKEGDIYTPLGIWPLPVPAGLAIAGVKSD
jgi:hypothetical protein